MSKRKKRKNKRAYNKIATNKLSPQKLELHAQQAIANHHYKIAIQQLKTLVKKEGQSESRLALLQQAYTGRAEELADKGMLKEAIALWDVATQYGLDPVDSRYLDWIMAAQQYYRLGKLYPQLNAENKRKLQPQLAAICLSGDLSALKVLPEDDPIRSGYPVANALLEGWCAGDDEKQLHQQMKAISFRSPYRDLRQIIQAGLLMEKSPEQLEKAIERIAKTSPFYPLVEQLCLAQLDNSAFVARLPSLSQASKHCALDIRDWTDKNTLKIVKKLERMGENPALATLSNTLLSLCKQLNEETLATSQKYWLYHTAKKVWAISKEEGINASDYRQLSLSVGALTPLEKDHYGYLSAIVSKMPPPYISRKIENYLKELTLTPDNDIKKADRDLMSALLRRYLVDRWKRYEENKLTDKSLSFLKQVVLDDPADDLSWAELLEYHLQQKKIKPARDVLKDALTHHPDNIKLLDLGVRIAIKGNAFVKASGYAKRILAVDPINTSAQQHLQQAHLAHARKQIKLKKWHLVHRELNQARQWKGTALSNTMIDVVNAYQIQAEKGVKVAASDFQKLNETSRLNKVELDFIIRHQAIQLGFASAVSLKNATLNSVWDTPDKDKIFSLINTVQQLMKVDPASINQPLSSLSKPLKKAATLALSAKEGASMCEFLMQTGEDELLSAYSLQLHKRYDDHPVFNYYLFVNRLSLDNGELDQLEVAWELTQEQGDEATSSRLVGLLQKFSNPFGQLVGNPFFDEDDIFGGNSPDPEEMELVMSSMLEMDELEGDEADEKMHQLMANILPIIEAKEVFGLANDLLGKKLAKLVRSQLGDSGLRVFCQRCLRGEDPHYVSIDMGVTGA